MSLAQKSWSHPTRDAKVEGLSMSTRKLPRQVEALKWSFRCDASFSRISTRRSPAVHNMMQRVRCTTAALPWRERAKVCSSAR